MQTHAHTHAHRRCIFATGRLFHNTIHRDKILVPLSLHKTHSISHRIAKLHPLRPPRPQPLIAPIRRLKTAAHNPQPLTTLIWNPTVINTSASQALRVWNLKPIWRWPPSWNGTQKPLIVHTPRYKIRLGFFEDQIKALATLTELRCRINKYSITQTQTV